MSYDLLDIRSRAIALRTKADRAHVHTSMLRELIHKLDEAAAAAEYAADVADDDAYAGIAASELDKAERLAAELAKAASSAAAELDESRV